MLKNTTYDIAVCGGGIAGVSAHYPRLDKAKKLYCLKNNICLVV